MFGRKPDKAVWASLVLANPPADPSKLSVERLSAATDHLLPQLRNIIMESVEIIQRTKNEDTRQSRLAVCKRHLDRMARIEPFANRQQRAIIKECKAAFGRFTFNRE